MATTRVVRELVLTCHPGPTSAVTVLTALLAWSSGHTPGRGALVTAAVLTGQLSIGWSNDLVDARRDRAVGRADKPLATGAVSEQVVRIACGVALVACIGLSLACGWASGLVHLLLGVASGWSYNLWFKRTVLSPLPYAVAFGALPDLADDEATGVRALPHRLGEDAVRRLAPAVLLAGTVVAAYGPGMDAAGWLLLVVCVALAVVAVLTRGRVPFVAAVLIALANVVALVARG